MQNYVEDYKITFRDRLQILDKDGKRVWVYPKKPAGVLYLYRNIIGYFLILLFFILPLIKINGDPLFLFNVIERKFIIFGAIFWPQDSYLFFLSFISFLVFVILFTVVFGRIWCGWTCPQTIFTELVYRRIEYLIEGDYSSQKRLNLQPWNIEKLWKKGIKHGLFWWFAFLISNTLLAFIIGADEVIKIAKEGISAHKTGFIAIIVFTTVVYILFSKIRELVCTVFCPYGRLQGVLLDANSIVVCYDYKRGEPRGHPNSSGDRIETENGDCIDCHNCVLVCPTKIDIRNGTQLECINCTACIDACNQVMKRINKPKGLIRYASEKQIANGIKSKITTRILLYSAVLAGLLFFLGYLLATRTETETTVLRTPGLLYQEQPGNKISNLYNIKLVNKTNKRLPIRVKLLFPKGEIQQTNNNFFVNNREEAENIFFVFIDKANIHSEKITIRLGIYSGERLLEEVTSTFFSPIK